MEYKIIRGKNQIGGNIVEVFTKTTKILLDIGIALDGADDIILPEVKALFDPKQYDAVFITHYHMDHIGLAYYIDKSIPVFMGKKCHSVLRAADAYKNKDTILPEGHLYDKVPIAIGDITITPYSCDHSAADSYMLLVEADGEKILYTGDFRSTGRKTTSFADFLNALPNKIGTLICEGTTLSRDNYIAETEDSLEEKIAHIVGNYSGPIFVLQSSMNIDRVVTMYKAAVRNRRQFLENLYLAEIAEAISGCVPRPSAFEKVKVFVTRKFYKYDNRYVMFSRYGEKRIGLAGIAKTRFIMCVHTSMMNYLHALNKRMSFKGGLLIYSLWSGYKEKNEVKEFLLACEKMGLDIITLHIGGHADAKTISELIAHTNPDKIEPIHTENPEWFEKLNSLDK